MLTGTICVFKDGEDATKEQAREYFSECGEIREIRKEFLSGYNVVTIEFQDSRSCVNAFKKYKNDIHSENSWTYINFRYNSRREQNEDIKYRKGYGPQPEISRTLPTRARKDLSHKFPGEGPGNSAPGAHNGNNNNNGGGGGYRGRPGHGMPGAGPGGGMGGMNNMNNMNNMNGMNGMNGMGGDQKMQMGNMGGGMLGGMNMTTLAGMMMQGGFGQNMYPNMIDPNIFLNPQIQAFLMNSGMGQAPNSGMLSPPMQQQQQQQQQPQQIPQQMPSIPPQQQQIPSLQQQQP